MTSQFFPPLKFFERIAAIRAPLEELAASFAYGKLVHEGLTLAIVGRPNVGKSSLFNRLVESDRAIVTATPGTTRDLVTETVSLGGIPVKLVDTAGIRTALDEAESIGVRKSMEALADADIVLVVRDASRETSISDDERQQDERLLELVEGRQAIVIWNKIDAAEKSFPKNGNSFPVVNASALTGAGVDQLRASILHLVSGDGGAQQDSGLLTNVRQKQLVSDSIAALSKATQAVPQKI